MAVIFYFSSRSADELGGWLPSFQRWAPWLSDFNPMHYVAYFGLALCVGYALGGRSATWAGLLLNVALCVLYGATDEWHQAYVPGRSPDWLDLRNDAIGATVGAAVLMAVYKARRRRRSRNCPPS